MADRGKSTKGTTKSGVVGAIDQIDELLKTLRNHGVQSFEKDGLKVEFNERAYHAEPIYSYEDTQEFDKKFRELADMSEEEIAYYSARG